MNGFRTEASELRTSRLTLALIAPVLAATLTGCGLVGGQGQGGGGESRQQQEPPPSQATQEPSGEVQPGNEQAPAEPGGPIATQEVENDGATLRVDITGLKRDNRLVTLQWNITVVDPGSREDWKTSTKMSANPAGLSVSDYDVSGVTLVDPVHSKRYLVARSGGDGTEENPGECVCSNTGNSLVAGEAASFHATFTAPPPDVTTINVDLVALGTYNDVPIS
jgi:hypothetical protein